jgi:hypothetical protein
LSFAHLTIEKHEDEYSTRIAIQVLRVILHYSVFHSTTQSVKVHGPATDCSTSMIQSSSLMIRFLVQWRKRSRPLPKKVSLHEPREPSVDLIRCMTSCWNSKDVIQFFQGPLLGLGHDEEYHHKCKDIEAGVKSEGPWRR